MYRQPVGPSEMTFVPIKGGASDVISIVLLVR